MTGFKISKIHCPIHRIKIKRQFYRTVLVLSAAGILAVHSYSPDHEVWVATVQTLLFALDPTV